MNNPLKSITNSSTMLDAYSYDRAPFRAAHIWTRSILAGVISTSLTAIGVYSGYLTTNPEFAAALGAQALNFKLAAGSIIACLLGYSLRDLFRAITTDVKTQLRVARANSWLMKGSACTHDYSGHIHMQQTPLSMVRFVEVDGGIKVYAIGKHEDHAKPILIDAMLFDDEYPALAKFLTHESDIRSALNEACAEWSEMVAELLCIDLCQDGATASAKINPLDEDFDLGLDDDLLDSLNTTDNVFGRASAPVQRGIEAIRSVSTPPPEAIKH